MTRKAHVKRLYAPDPNTGDPDPTSDTWIDVMRIDQVRSFAGYNLGGTAGQEIIHAYMWKDDQGENQNPARKTQKIAVYDQTNPPSDKPQPGDPDTVTLYLVDQIRSVKYGDPQGMQSWLTFKTFVNTSEDVRPTRRKVTILKIPNNDFGGPDQDPFQGRDVNYLMKWDDYADLLQQGFQQGVIDGDQHVYLEVVDEYETYEYANVTTTSNTPAGGSIWMVPARANANDGSRGTVGVEYLFEVFAKNYGTLSIQQPNFAPPVLPALPSGDPERAVRTDPLQAIVNVSWGGLAVEFYDKDS